MKFQTQCVHVGVNKDTLYNSCITPIYPSSTFYWNSLDSNSGYDYTRSGNPTREALHENLAALEGGAGCRATATGMAAVNACMHLFRPGDHLLAPYDLYGGTFRLMAELFTNMGLRFSFVNMRDLEAVRAAITPETRGLWIETPSNPLLNISDIAALAEIAKDAGLISIADNTFLSPALQRPLELGCDIVMHSTTKYLNGHSDVVGGAIISKSEEHAGQIAHIVNALGLAASPFDCWLVLRGIKTLGPRMKAHEENAMALARMLREHSAVERVYYPGLPDHADHELAKRQQSGFGGMLSFDLQVNGEGRGREAAETLFAALHHFALAESLGGVESLIEYPESMSHASMTAEARLEAGISDRTIRVSAGIEAADDLVTDLASGLDQVASLGA